MAQQHPYKRVLLKISGEALAPKGGDGIFDLGMIKQITEEIMELRSRGIQIAVLLGGGNIWRGAEGKANGMDGTEADNIGMCATIMNAIAMRDAFNRLDARSTRLMSSISVNAFCEDWIIPKANHHLDNGLIVICAAGIGEPNFSTDTAAVQRARNIRADLVLKGTHGTVQGIYDCDPSLWPDAKLIPRLTYDEVIKRGFEVMDPTAFTHADQSIPLIVFNIMTAGNITKALRGEAIGTLVTAA